MFELLKRDEETRARRGTLHTSHGLIQTPCFMPVGTQGSVKGVSPLELKELHAQIILGNTYHLFIRPGMEVMRTMGGLHRFMSWDGPILTDSGGFQVFSLARLRKITDDGVHFNSHVDGAPFFIGPREAVQIQRQLGSDILMCFDECPPWPCTDDQLKAAVDRTLRWAKMCREEWLSGEVGPTASQQLFAIVQGGSSPEMRRRCAEELVALDLPGYAIGGVSVGEPEDHMLAAIEATEPWLPANKPRYAMGLGQPHQLVKMIARGVDMFDCVLPTRVARNGTAYTRQGTVNLKNSANSTQSGPIEEGCRCYACQKFSRAYVRHLLKSEEILGLRLVTLHNLYFYLELMRQAREAVEQGNFASWSRVFLDEYKPRDIENASD